MIDDAAGVCSVVRSTTIASECIQRLLGLIYYFVLCKLGCAWIVACSADPQTSVVTTWLLRVVPALQSLSLHQ